MYFSLAEFALLLSFFMLTALFMEAFTYWLLGVISRAFRLKKNPASSFVRFARNRFIIYAVIFIVAVIAYLFASIVGNLLGSFGINFNINVK